MNAESFNESILPFSVWIEKAVEGDSHLTDGGEEATVLTFKKEIRVIH
jgi:hypothetical protein